MRIVVDLDARDVWRIQDKAERTNRTPGEVIRDELATRRTTLEYHTRVRSRVLAGLCDADIATELGRTVSEIARVRRQQQLPANRRYPRRTS